MSGAGRPLARRAFFVGPGAGTAEGQARPPLEPAGAGEGDLVRYRRRAMGCQWEMLLPAGATSLTVVLLEGFALVDRLESLMSVYRAESALSRINAGAAERPVCTDPELFELLWRARELHRETEGAFDPTAGALVRVWGFRRARGEVPAAALLEEALARVGMERWVELDRSCRSVRFRRPGIDLDLGAIGKGYAVARVCDLLRARGVPSALVHAGQSTASVLGSPPWDEGWVVAISDPLRPERVLARVRLRDGALSMSGACERSFAQDGRRYGHILDPRTGRPAAELLGATVLAGSATEADALSTAFYVLGAEGAARYCAGHADVGALLVCSRSGGDGYELVQLGAVERYGEVVI